MLAENKALREKLERLENGRSEFFRVDIGEGVSLDGWCMLPPKFDPTAKYPLLVHVYGEPAGQTVLDRWGGSNHLWHRMLAQNGYVVMSFDNRGTPSPRGRAWRKSVFHQIGILAPKEQAAAVQAVLRSRPYLDKDRVGIWGWSGGGSMTLNAIFKFPDLYKTAIADCAGGQPAVLRHDLPGAVHGLAGRQRRGFRQGSPINYAHQLKGNLLLIHGTGDDNCHYQGTEALINELIRHNKPFTMMAYPNRSHGIYEGQNTTLHLRELMTALPEAKPATRGERGSPRANASGSELKDRSMIKGARRRMTLLDAVLLVGSAAIGLGLFELVHRTLFNGWIWITDVGVPDVWTWSTTEAIVTLSDVTAFLLPIVLAWTVLLVMLRMRAPRPPWRHIWRQPGMAACLAVLVSWSWTVLALFLAMNVTRVARAQGDHGG